MNIWGDFQICVSVSLRLSLYLTEVNSKVNGGVLYRAGLLENAGLQVRHIMLLIDTYIMTVNVRGICFVASVTKE